MLKNCIALTALWSQKWHFCKNVILFEKVDSKTSANRLHLIFHFFTIFHFFQKNEQKSRFLPFFTFFGHFWPFLAVLRVKSRHFDLQKGPFWPHLRPKTRHFGHFWIFSVKNGFSPFSHFFTNERKWRNAIFAILHVTPQRSSTDFTGNKLNYYII